MRSKMCNTEIWDRIFVFVFWLNLIFYFCVLHLLSCIVLYIYSKAFMSFLKVYLFIYLFITRPAQYLQQGLCPQSLCWVF